MEACTLGQVWRKNRTGTASAYVVLANHAKRTAWTDNWKEKGQSMAVGEDVRGCNGITFLGERRFTQHVIGGRVDLGVRRIRRTRCETKA